MNKLLLIVIIISTSMPSLGKSSGTSVKASLKYLSLEKNQSDILQTFKKHMSSDELKYLDEQKKTLHKKRIDVRLAGVRRFKIGSSDHAYIVSSSGKHIKHKNKIFRLDTKKSFIWNYENIKKQFSSDLTVSLSEGLLPQAHAQSKGSYYEIVVLLYYLKWK